MALRDIITLPDPRLRIVSKPVSGIDASIRRLAADMFETMYDAPGIGLAAIQIPEYYEEVERPAKVKVKYLDLDGAPREVEAAGLLATCLQHEIDHLNGVLFIDHLSKLKRSRIIKKFTKAARRAGDE
jgi:peptide deformylase